MLNLAQERQPAQALVLLFPKKERLTMTGIDEGYTRFPNLLIDSEIMADLSDKAFKCLVFIVRQTLGFGRNSHTISITQFQKYCGIKKEETVTKVIRELEQSKAIKVERKSGCLNEYFLTLDQYQQTVPPPSKGGSPMKQGESTTATSGESTPMKQGTIKENFKENIKENNKNKAPAEFVPQDRGALNFIDYHSEDSKLYSLKDLSGTYPIKQDFMAQAAVSFPKLSQDIVLEQLKELAQWSVGQPERISQKWMTTWLNWLRNYQPAKPKAEAKQPKAEQPKRHRYGQGVIPRGES
ncbi:replication protein [Acinetobacter sp. F-1]|uniref:replication protein n=1 Tax=Acinetobacter sp. F-1 TaxID=1796981 RepID=UPI001FD14FB8|nr:replication protein [Acinetobacter sp. F-1]